MKKGYIDLFLLPLPKKHLRAYCRMSQRLGKIMKEYGALDYREFLGNDLYIKGTTPFPSKLKLKRGEVMISAIIGFRSRAQRDKINKRIITDARVIRMIEESIANPLFDMKRMVYGGFETVVNA